jgi:glycosyltransferase involved in cell wall biosynthesis
MRIAIYNRGIPFDAETPFTQPLGGSETSIVHMARELSRLDQDVTVYCSVPPVAAVYDRRSSEEPKTGGHRPPLQPTYKSFREFFTDCTSARWDVLISFRSFDPFLLGRVAPRMIFWTGDAADQPALKHFEHAALQQNIDRVFCVSNWQRDSFIRAFNLPAEKVIATRNGFCTELVPEPSPRDWTRCAYSSTPFRGLEFLLRFFPHMRQRVPTLRLDVFSSMKVYGWNREADEEAYGRIYKATEQAGVTWHGSVAQPVLLQHLARCGLFLYPNTFAETSCIAAIEAQACGAIVITTARGALPETVQNGKTGICLPGEPATPDYQREFITTVTQLLQSPARLAELSSAARECAFATYPWSNIASEWISIFEAIPATEVHARWSGPLVLLQKTQDYIRNGNVTAANRVLATLEQTPFLKNEVDALKGQLSTWM